MDFENIERHFRDKLETLNSVPPRTGWKVDNGWSKLNNRLSTSYMGNNSIKFLLGTSPFIIIGIIVYMLSTKQEFVIINKTNHVKENFVTGIKIQTNEINKFKIDSSHENLFLNPSNQKKELEKIHSNVQIYDPNHNNELSEQDTSTIKIYTKGNISQNNFPQLQESVPTEKIHYLPTRDAEHKVFGRIPPPGTSEVIGGNIYVDQSEAANVHWLEFLYFVRRDSGETYYTSMLPDTSLTKWLKDWRAIEYRYYPVVGISYAQALEYCKWRTAVVNNSGQLSFKVRYSLPSKNEWKAIANYCMGKGYTTPKNSGLKYDATKIPTWPQKFSLSKKNKIKGKTAKIKVYNILGNVSEMTSEKGISMGGSWFHSVDENNINIYTRPSTWLGFRCIAEYVK